MSWLSVALAGIGSYELLQHPDRAKFDTSSLKRIGAGGAPVAPRFPGELSKAFTGASPMQGSVQALVEPSHRATLPFVCVLARVCSWWWLMTGLELWVGIGVSCGHMWHIRPAGTLKGDIVSERERERERKRAKGVGGEHTYHVEDRPATARWLGQVCGSTIQGGDGVRLRHAEPRSA